MRSANLDRPAEPFDDHATDEHATDLDAPGHSAATILAMLEQSRHDIAAGRTVPLLPVLARLRTRAATIRRDRAGTKQADPQGT
jgi:hypothetical protein